MIYQQMSFLVEPESNQGSLPVFQGASLASRIQLQECVKRLVMNVTFGRSTGESLAKLSPDGSWQRMYGDFYQVKMGGSFEEYSGILPTWGMMLDGVVTGLPMWERFIPENGLQLLPAIVASDSGLTAIIGAEDSYKLDRQWNTQENKPAGYRWLAGTDKNPEIVTNVDCKRMQGCCEEPLLGFPGLQRGQAGEPFQEAERRFDTFESRLCRTLYGIPNGVSRIKALGNAVVPQ